MKTPWSTAFVMSFLWSGCGGGTAGFALGLHVIEGEIPALHDPGLGGRTTADVGSVVVRLDGEFGKVEHTVAANPSALVRTRFDVASDQVVRVSIVGVRSDGDLYSAGQSPPLRLSGERVDLSLFMGPLYAFTPLPEPLPGPRLRMAVAPLGDVGALIVGGSERTASGIAPREPLIAFRVAEGRACGTADSCLSGAAPDPRDYPIAVALTDGSVLHGLGQLVDGSPTADLYVTSTTGVTTALSLTGDVLPALSRSAAARWGATGVAIIGGLSITGPSRDVFVVEPTGKVRALQKLTIARYGAAAMALENGDVLVVGGHDGAQALTSAEAVLANGTVVQPTVLEQPGRAALMGPRLDPSLALLPSGAIAVGGGGTTELEVFDPQFGIPGAFITIDPPPQSSGVHIGASPVVAWTDGGLLVIGGEVTASVPLGGLFAPAVNAPGITGASYAGTWLPIGPSSVGRAGARAQRLADRSVLLVGGSTTGVGADPSAPEIAARKLEILTPLP